MAILKLMGMARLAVRHHGGMIVVLRRIQQVFVFEGFHGLKQRFTRMMGNWITSSELPRARQEAKSKMTIAGKKRAFRPPRHPG
jgi:hypothetical protein